MVTWHPLKMPICSYFYYISLKPRTSISANMNIFICIHIYRWTDYTVSLVVDSFLTCVIESITEAILIINLPPIVEAARVSSSKDESNPKELHTWHVILFSKPTKFRPFKGKGLEANPGERVGDTRRSPPSNFNYKTRYLTKWTSQ